MSVKLDIFKAALATVGAKDIASETDGSVESKNCNIFYAIARDSVLRDFDWSFARKSGTLALLTESHTGWDYAYQYPSDCIKARFILDASGLNNNGDYTALDPNNHEVRLNAAGSGHTFLCAFPTCEILYTSRVLNETLFDAMFVQALVLRLASMLAQPIKRDKALAESILKEYTSYIQDAKGASANEGSETFKRPSKYRQ